MNLLYKRSGIDRDSTQHLSVYRGMSYNNIIRILYDDRGDIHVSDDDLNFLRWPLTKIEHSLPIAPHTPTVRDMIIRKNVTNNMKYTRYMDYTSVDIEYQDLKHVRYGTLNHVTTNIVRGSEDVLKYITKLPILMLELDLWDSVQTTVLDIPYFPVLQDLTIHGGIPNPDNNRIVPPLLWSINFNNLQSLFISNTIMNIDIWNSLPSLTNLSVLYLDSVWYTDHGDNDVTVDLSVLSNLHLLSLCIIGNGRHVGWNALPRTLVALDVNIWDNVPHNADLIASIKRMSCLRALSLARIGTLEVLQNIDLYKLYALKVSSAMDMNTLQKYRNIIYTRINFPHNNNELSDLMLSNKWGYNDEPIPMA